MAGGIPAAVKEKKIGFRSGSFRQLGHQSNQSKMRISIQRESNNIQKTHTHTHTRALPTHPPIYTDSNHQWHGQYRQRANHNKKEESLEDVGRERKAGQMIQRKSEWLGEECLSCLFRIVHLGPDDDNNIDEIEKEAFIV